MPTRNKRLISAEDLYTLQLIGDCQISPDGEHVAYTVQRIDRKTHKKYSNLWLAPTGRGRARQFTHGDHVDSQPRWSPDGSQLAFLSNRDDEKQPQLYLISTHGGEARRLTDLKGEMAMFAWSPTGKQFVCQVRKKDKETIEREADEQKKKLGVVARHITRIWYKFDGSGYRPNERWHIWTIDAATGKARQLTNGDRYGLLFQPQRRP
jgi:dipeptidyl aminopeptidase/acylaminoacyl peptidase